MEFPEEQLKELLDGLDAAKAAYNVDAHTAGVLINPPKAKGKAKAKAKADAPAAAPTAGDVEATPAEAEAG